MKRNLQLYGLLVLLSGLLCVSVYAMSAYTVAAEQSAKPPAVALPEVVEVSGHIYQYRMSGEFLKDRLPVRAPKIQMVRSAPLQVMKYQVTNREYGYCVAANACALPWKLKRVPENEKPVTGISFVDATRYAKWLSETTDYVWRLPTDQEWVSFADDRYLDDVPEEEEQSNDPSVRMLQDYQQAIDRDREPDPVIKEKSAYGANKYGVYDLAGNVWEWTSTCYQRYEISANDEVKAFDSGNCGVRVVEGKHRSYMTYFIQDAQSGGCAVGTPPDFLGLRLIRDKPKLFTVRGMKSWWGNLTGDC